MDRKQIKFIFLVCLFCSTSATMQVFGQIYFNVLRNNPAFNLLDADNYHQYVNQPPSLEPLLGGGSQGPTPYLAVRDATLKLGTETAVYDAAQGSYLIEGEHSFPLRLTVSHPSFQTYELTIEKGEIPLPTTIVMAGKEELIYTQRGVPIPVPNPSIFSEPADMKDGFLLPKGSIVGTRGCIMGTFSGVDRETIQALFEEFDVPLFEIDEQAGWLAIAPAPETPEEEFQEKVLPQLRAQTWIRDAGPVLESTPDHYQFLTSQIYIEAKNGQSAELENYLKQNQSIVTIRSCTDKPGYNLTVDPLLGTEILPLARSLADHPQVVFADVHLNRIVLADLRD